MRSRASAPPPHRTSGRRRSSLAEIAARGRLIVGVDQNTNLFSFRDPTTGTLHGIRRRRRGEIARDLFGDPSKVEFRLLTSADRFDALRERGRGSRRQVAPRSRANGPSVSPSPPCTSRPINVCWCRRGPVSPARRIWPGNGSAPPATPPRWAPFAACRPRPRSWRSPTGTTASWPPATAGRRGEHRRLHPRRARRPGPESRDRRPADSRSEPYGIGVNKNNDDLVRFVNGTLDRMRADGTWTRLYDNWLTVLGPSAGPPAPRTGTEVTPSERRNQANTDGRPAIHQGCAVRSVRGRRR